MTSLTHPEPKQARFSLVSIEQKVKQLTAGLLGLAMLGVTTPAQANSTAERDRAIDIYNASLAMHYVSSIKGQWGVFDSSNAGTPGYIGPMAAGASKAIGPESFKGDLIPGQTPTRMAFDANTIFGDVNNFSGKVWHRSGNLKPISLGPVTFDPKIHGLTFGCFQDEDQVLIVFYGTDWKPSEGRFGNAFGDLAIGTKILPEYGKKVPTLNGFADMGVAYYNYLKQTRCLQNSQNKTFMVTGHSLGGAVAGHVALLLLKNNDLASTRPHRLVTLSAPHYAFPKFKKKFEKLIQRKAPLMTADALEVEEDIIPEITHPALNPFEPFTGKPKPLGRSHVVGWDALPFTYGTVENNAHSHMQVASLALKLLNAQSPLYNESMMRNIASRNAVPVKEGPVQRVVGLPDRPSTQQQPNPPTTTRPQLGHRPSGGGIVVGPVPPKPTTTATQQQSAQLSERPVQKKPVQLAFRNRAPYDTAFVVRYLDETGKQVKWSTPTLPKGRSASFTIPDENFVLQSVTARYKDGFTWKRIDTFSYGRAAKSAPKNFQLSGALFQRPGFSAR